MTLRFVSLCALFGALALSPSSARAEGADPKKAEAAQRFDRGLQLFDDGDNAGALAEFKKTYELFPNPVVLYNIGLVYAAMGRPVNAVEALEPVVTAGALTGEKADRAKRTLEDQKARIGRLTVTTKPEGARIEIDNVEVAKTPLTGPLRVAEGNHIVGAIAEGYAPARKEIVVAGNSDASVSLELVETQGKQLANLTVKSQTRGADVVVDGQVSGKTPLSTSITLVAGHHKVELKRAGYASETREVDVGAGATGELSFNLQVDPSQLGSEGATLGIESNEKSLDITLDGEHKGIYAGAMRIPRGPHHLSIAAAGFYPVDRDVDLEVGKPNIVHLELEPTPETRADYESSASFHRTWGWIGIGLGAAIAGGSAAYFAISTGNWQKKVDAAQANYDVANDIYNRGQNLGDTTAHPCVKMSADDPAACNALTQDAASNLDSAQKGLDTRKIVGITGMAVGGAVLVTGVVLLLTGDDPHRYDHPKSNSLGKRQAPQEPRFAVTPGPGQYGAGFSLAF